MLRLKRDVRLVGLRPEALVAVYACERAYQEVAGKDLILTSVTDGQHSRGSLHYSGCAFDCRTRHLEDGEAERVTDLVAGALGEDFDVVLEATHLHVEYQPKQPYA